MQMWRNMSRGVMYVPEGSSSNSLAPLGVARATVMPPTCRLCWPIHGEDVSPDHGCT